MKANELMIDDWVTVIADDKLFPSKYVGKSIPCKVEGFSCEPIVQPSYTEKGIGIDLIPQIGLMVRVANNFGYMYFEAEKLSPIPITKDILEQNGFEVREGCTTAWDWFDGETSVHISGSHTCPIGQTLTIYVPGGTVGAAFSSHRVISELKIRGIHELQNALRLCRINKEITL